MTTDAFDALLVEQEELARVHQQWCDICDEDETICARQRRAEAYAAFREVAEQIEVALSAERTAERAAEHDSERASA